MLLLLLILFQEGCSRINELSCGNQGKNFKEEFKALINALGGIHYYLMHKTSRQEMLILTERGCLQCSVPRPWDGSG